MKRLFDFLTSLIGLVILSPVFLILSVLIVIDSKGGVFFRGVRVGQYGKPFKEHKNITACNPFTEKEIKVA